MQFQMHSAKRFLNEGREGRLSAVVPSLWLCTAADTRRDQDPGIQLSSNARGSGLAGPVTRGVAGAKWVNERGGVAAGGDVSRKRKLLEKQKEGKRRMARLGGGVEAPPEVFHALIKMAAG